MAKLINGLHYKSVLFCLNNKKKNLLGKWRFILGFAQGYI